MGEPKAVRWERGEGDLAGILFLDTGSRLVVDAARQRVRAASTGYR